MTPYSESSRSFAKQRFQPLFTCEAHLVDGWLMIHRLRCWLLGLVLLILPVTEKLCRRHPISHGFRTSSALVFVFGPESDSLPHQGPTSILKESRLYWCFLKPSFFQFSSAVDFYKRILYFSFEPAVSGLFSPRESLVCRVLSGNPSNWRFVSLV